MCTAIMIIHLHNCSFCKTEVLWLLQSNSSYFLSLQPPENHQTLHVYITFCYSFFCQWALHVSATVNNAAMNMGVYITFWDHDFYSFGYIPQIVDHRILFLLFWGIDKIFNTVNMALLFYMPNCRVSNFSTVSPMIVFWILVILMGVK